MNVKTLIHYLQQFPDDMQVIIADSRTSNSGSMTYGVDERVYNPFSSYVDSRGTIEPVQDWDELENENRVVVLLPTE